MTSEEVVPDLIDAGQRRFAQTQSGIASCVKGSAARSLLSLDELLNPGLRASRRVAMDPIAPAVSSLNSARLHSPTVSALSAKPRGYHFLRPPARPISRAALKRCSR